MTYEIAYTRHEGEGGSREPYALAPGPHIGPSPQHLHIVPQLRPQLDTTVLLIPRHYAVIPVGHASLVAIT